MALTLPREVKKNDPSYYDTNSRLSYALKNTERLLSRTRDKVELEYLQDVKRALLHARTQLNKGLERYHRDDGKII